MVDQICRVLFPALFALFNLVYWIYPVVCSRAQLSDSDIWRNIVKEKKPAFIAHYLTSKALWLNSCRSEDVDGWLHTTRLDVVMIVSLWNVTGISAALLPRCLHISKRLEKFKPEYRGFETSRDHAIRRLTEICYNYAPPCLLWCHDFNSNQSGYKFSQWETTLQSNVFTHCWTHTENDHWSMNNFYNTVAVCH